jgi:hypothetical protein
MLPPTNSVIQTTPESDVQRLLRGTQLGGGEERDQAVIPDATTTSHHTCVCCCFLRSLLFALPRLSSCALKVCRAPTIETPCEHCAYFKPM